MWVHLQPSQCRIRAINALRVFYLDVLHAQLQQADARARSDGGHAKIARIQEYCSHWYQRYLADILSMLHIKQTAEVQTAAVVAYMDCVRAGAVLWFCLFADMPWHTQHWPTAHAATTPQGTSRRSSMFTCSDLLVCSPALWQMRP